MTYRHQELCAALTEGNLRLLSFNSGTTDWELAVDGNSDGGAGATFYAGSSEDFAATLGGAPLSTALGTYGVDTVNNHVWAVVDHEGTFGVGEPGKSCGMAGDCNADGVLDLVDYAGMEACLAGPGGGLGSGCDCYDLDADGDVDLFDFAELQVSFTSP